jgi:PmbA protein
MNDTIDIAGYALEALKKAGADKAACKVVRVRKDEFNIEANKFSLLRTLFTDELYLKALCGGKKGVAVINKLDKESIARAVGDCVALAASALPDEAEDIAPKAENKTFDQTVGGPDMDGLFSRTRDFLGQLSDEYPKIVLESMATDWNDERIVYLNSNGAEFQCNREHYQINTMFSAKDGSKSSSFNGYGASLASLSVPFIDLDLHRELLADSEKSIDTREASGKYVGKVVVAPSCEDMIWQTIMECFLDDTSMVQGTSRWKDALGTKVADSKLTMRLAPLDPGIVGGERFTADGFESKNADLIRDGILTSFALSLYGANKCGKPRAATTAFDSIEVAAGDTPLADIIKGIDRGILLGRFSGASPGPGGDVSGVAKNSFVIENGAVTDALSETMVSFNITDILMNIVAISSERCKNGVRILPWCCFDGVTISGK